LWVKSNYSFLEGASHPEELVERAHELGLPALCLSDRDGVYGVARAHVKARELGQKLILGAQVSVGDASLAARLDRPEVARTLQRTLLFATDLAAWGRLCRLLSLGRAESPKGYSVVTVEQVCEAQADEGLIAVVIDPGLVAPLREAFDNSIYGLVTRHRSEKDNRDELQMREAASPLGIPLVGGNEVLYHHRSRRMLQDVVACVRAGKKLSAAGHIIRENAEHALESPAAMAARFADTPQLLTRTLEIGERCNFSLSQIRYVYPAEHLPEGKDEGAWLRELTFRGAHQRYQPAPFNGTIPDASVRQIERELELIAELDYGGYFLTMWEVVQFCKSQSILCQGRGSAANSIVCYCLGITAIDPVRMDLLFERFLSRERAEPPDIDLDIEHERREEVIQWVYERYGRRRAAMVANIIRYRTRSAVREVGKVLGMPSTALDRLSKLLGPYGAGQLNDAFLSEIGLDPAAPSHAHLVSLVSELVDFPRHLSIHPGGFLLGHLPVDSMVPIEPATMENRTVIQWDKYDVEALGLFKVDLLALGSMTMIRKCFGLIRQHEGLELEMNSIPHDDDDTYDLLGRGDTVGVFQVESRAQMAMLPRLKPRSFYDLVIEVAIVRPGPIQGDMVHPYLRRRAGKEEVSYPHPALERVLSKTMGVPIFQEQVMKLAIAVADYTPGEADQLRRDMGAWRSSGRIEAHRDRLITRMIQHGIDHEFAERVFNQIRGFGEYGFPESHAASFALIAYVTAYLRTHHVAAFSCALLNAQPMGFYSPATIVEDAKRRGVEIRPVDLRHSSWDCTLEAGRDSELSMRMGLRYIKGLGERERTHLEHAAHDGPFNDLDDLVRRSRLNRKALSALAQSGALGGFGIGRRNAMWEIRGAIARVSDTLPISGEMTPEHKQPHFGRLTHNEEILWDYRASHHSARGHPLSCIRPQLDQQGLPDAAELNSAPNRKRFRYVGMVICRQRPQTASGVTFYTLEDETGFVNLVVWQDVFSRHEILARTAMLLGVSGKVERNEGVVHFIADELWEPRVELRHEGIRSRDFH
jgi:error-prone DNA polymerase